MRPLTLLDSISAVGPAEAGHVVVPGSHGGLAAARLVLAQASPPPSVTLNAAGVGKHAAGILALLPLQAIVVVAPARSQSASLHHLRGLLTQLTSAASARMGSSPRAVVNRLASAFSITTCSMR